MKRRRGSPNINLDVKIHIADAIFVGDSTRTFETDVWITDAASRVLSKFHKKDVRTGNLFVKKLQECAKGGFAAFEGGPVRHEWDRVYRFGHDSTLFRLIGGYTDGKREFLIVDGFTKRGQQLSVPERARIDTVAKVLAAKAWRKREQ